jgi:protein-S-isoprenylcysteine O-methyltransferase Ste14
MFIIYWVLIGLLTFTGGAVILGTWLKRNPSKENAEKSSRIMHFLFFPCLIMPPIVGLFYPGYTSFDGLVGLESLPWKPFFLSLGILLLVPGFYFMIITNKLLRSLGNGANAFRLTKEIVAENVYERTRNPMSLGFYLLTLAAAFIAGTTFGTLVALLGFIPSHIFFLKYFEELELELRFGESYLDYKKSVPFLMPKVSV